MSAMRLSGVFTRCRNEGRAALVGYLTAGDPDVSTSRDLLATLAKHVDILEVGMPFSDPMADGPVIQAASERALASGTKIADVFALTAELRSANPDLGIVLMGYANIAYAMGFDTFAERAVAAGADGVLLVDIPPEEGGICDDIFARHGLDRILLLSPTSTDERIRLACSKGTGFIYYVSLTGITGAEMGAIDQIRQKTTHIQSMTDMPVCVGFGVKTPEQVAEVGAFADGVVVGSHFVSQITSNPDSGSIITALDRSALAMKSAIAKKG
ncbi:tryptophan synthase, alpha chain [Mariprofundus ferrinatatus]|uniref:Tryptophan synthase alpha chain n=1 Tax=Mariprofundus ferrinatatus TaxID=1921087 RepID=A0A2K8L6X4_9PROT|nr:tryptophan synthase subunit alpha [Mariprofundus ferrinatatus]ATX83075.1 tryptophan synthase, alpha chain [Mariprofundus ferrinatatus]